MTIEQQFENLINWSANKKIMFVEGDFELNKSPIVDLPNKGQISLDIFQQLVEKLDVKVIIYDILHFNLETFKIFEESIDNIEDTETKRMFESLRSFENKYFGYTLHIFNNGMTYRLENYNNATSDFLKVQKAVYNYIKENTLGSSKFKLIPQEKVIQLGTLLAENENYPKLKTRTQRENFARELFSEQFEKLNVNDIYSTKLIVSQAETHYESDIKPKFEKELKQKISDLLNNGWTKVKIASELGISKDILNKYV